MKETNSPMEAAARGIARTSPRRRPRRLLRGRLCARSVARPSPKDFDIATDARAGGRAEDFSRAPTRSGRISASSSCWKTDSNSRSRPSAPTAPISMAGARSKSISPRAEEDAAPARFHDQRDVLRSGEGRGDRFRRRPRGSRAATDPRDRRSGRSVSPKIGCGCCAPSGSPPCSGSRSSRRPGRRSWRARRRSSEISAERIREELVRFFFRRNRVRGWDLLDASGLMDAILPELEAMKGCEQPPQFHPEGDVFKHTRIMLETVAGGGLAAARLQRSLSRHRQTADRDRR